MPDLADGESTEMKGSGSKPYQLKNVGGVYSCTCPAWRNQSLPIEKRTCKHLRKLRGDDAEEARICSALPPKPARPEGSEEDEGPPVLLAESWDNAADLAGWWMSEKLDGVRAYWDGNQLLSRAGNIFYAPDWFVEGLPNHPLDGELWIARKAFQRTVGIVKRQDKPDLWQEVRFLIFDAPASSDPFEDRMKFLADGVRSWKAKFAAIHEHVPCKSVEHLREELAHVEQLGGEGLMLREPGSKYEAGRSTTLLKVKTFKDAEAIVIGHERGKGKHAGRLGAVTARLGDGTEFSVGTGFSDRERENPPAIGSIITFRYQELTDAGVPRFPSYVGLRPDANVKAARKTTPRKESPAPEPIKPVAVKLVPVPVSVPILPPVSSGGATMAATPKRYFECTEDGASKFWEVWMEGKDVTTNWGKIGTTGQTKTKAFADEAKARKEYDKLLAEKTSKGYVEKARPA